MPSDEQIFELIDRRLAALRKRCRDERAVPLALVAMQQLDENTEQPVLFAMADFPQTELPRLFAEIAEQVLVENVLRN